MPKRFRLLPFVIVVAASLFVFKAGEVWRGVEPVFAGLGVGEVLAQESEDEAEAVADEEAVAEGEEAAAEGEDEDGDFTELAVSELPSFTQAEIDMLKDLGARRDQLDSRERAQDLRERLLEAAEARIDEKIAELKTIEETIRARARAAG